MKSLYRTYLINLQMFLARPARAPDSRISPKPTTPARG
jgi:hypothetical protein